MHDTSSATKTGLLDRIDGYIAKADRLPPAPFVLTQLLTLLRDPNTDSVEIINIMAYEPSLTASVLRLSNSACFAGGEPVQDLYNAIMRLGFAQIYQLVAVVCGARSLAPAHDGNGSHDTRLWTHSVSAALAAELLAKDFGAEPAVAFTAGLLHDIGKVVLTEALGPTYVTLVQELDAHQPYPLDREKKLLAVDHCEVGGRLLARWKFPAPVVAAIWNHHTPAAAKPHEKLAALIYWGDMIAFSIEESQPDKEQTARLAEEQMKTAGMLALTADQLAKYTAQVRTQLKNVNAIMELTA